MGSVTFMHLLNSNFMQKKSEKKWWTNPEKTKLQMDGQMDRAKFIGPSSRARSNGVVAKAWLWPQEQWPSG